MKPMRETNHMRLLLASFERGDELSSTEASTVAYLSPQMARRYLKWMHENKLIYVTRWERKRGPWFAIYAHGSHKDAPKPTPMTGKERSKASRKSRRLPKPDLLSRVFSRFAAHE